MSRYTWKCDGCANPATRAAGLERWCGPCYASLSATAACRALAAGLLGVCWAMAADVVRRDWVIRWDWPREMRAVRQDFADWLLDQARPPGCRAPWEEST